MAITYRARVSLKLKKRSLYAAGSGVAIALGVSAGVAMADDTTTPSPTVQSVTALQEVVVTAEKRQTKLLETPVSVSAVGGARLNGVTDSSLADIQNLVPGLSVSVTNVLIRGIGSNIPTADASPGVALHLDGVFLGRQYAALDTFYDEDRVEVLRGPQGTLYGRNATGGVVNVITRKPTTTPEGYLNVTAGNYGAAEVRGAAGGPVGDSGILVRAAFIYSGHDGRIDNLYPGSSRLDDKDELAGRLQIHVPLGERVKLDLNADSMRNDDHGLRTIFQSVPITGALLPSPALFGAVIPPLNRETVNLNSADDDHFRESGVSAKLTWDAGDVLFSSLSAYRTTEYSTQNDFDGSQVNYGYLSKYNINQRQFSEELNISSKDDGPLTWVTGLYFYRETVANPNESDLPLFGLKAPVVANLETDAAAGYGQATYRFDEHFDLTGGLRYSQDRKSLDQQGNEFGLPLSDRVSDRWAATTWRLTADYHAPGAWLFYATVSNGFKSGGFNVGTSGAPTFNPEKVVNYEIGAKGRAADGRIELNADIFDMKYTNLQVFTFTGITSIIDNAAHATISGLEAEVRTLPLPDPNLQLNFGLTLLDAKYDKYLSQDQITGITSNVAGKRLENSPPVKIGVQLQYRWIFPAGYSITPVADYSYQSKTYFRPQNDDLFSQPPYSLLNMSVKWTSANLNWNVSAFIKNVTDERYDIGSSLITSTQIRVINLGDPRTFGVRIGYQF